MGYSLTRNNVEAVIAIFNILAEKECTLTDARDILRYVSGKLDSAITVPKRDYNAMFSEQMKEAIEYDREDEENTVTVINPDDCNSAEN